MNRRHWLHLGLALSLAGCASADNAADDARESYFRAIRQNDASAMKRILRSGVDPNTVNAQGDPGLFVALKEGALDVAQVLIATPGIHLNQLNAHGESPLMIACLKGEMPLIKEMIKQGAAIDKDGWTPLHYAVTGGHEDVVKLLLSYGVNVNARSPNGTTPLMMAARYGSEEIAKLLLADGADVHAVNEQQLSALDFAKRSDRESMVRLISAAMQKAGTKPGEGGHW